MIFRGYRNNFYPVIYRVREDILLKEDLIIIITTTNEVKSFSYIQVSSSFITFSLATRSPPFTPIVIIHPIRKRGSIRYRREMIYMAEVSTASHLSNVIAIHETHFNPSQDNAGLKGGNMLQLLRGLFLSRTKWMDFSFLSFPFENGEGSENVSSLFFLNEMNVIHTYAKKTTQVI